MTRSPAGLAVIAPLESVRMFALDLPLPPKLLSPNVRAHWGAKHRATRDHRYDCAMLARAGKPRGWEPCAVSLEVEYRCSAKAAGYIARDVQNATAALKAMVDGLVDAGIAPNDSKKWLQWDRFNLVTRKHPRGDGVTVIVRAL